MAKVKEQIDIQVGEQNIVALYYADDVDGYGFEFIDWNTGDYSMDFSFGAGEDVEQLCYQVFRMFCELIKQNPLVTLNVLRDFKDKGGNEHGVRC
jgi:hypothetical protein